MDMNINICAYGKHTWKKLVESGGLRGKRWVWWRKPGEVTSMEPKWWTRHGGEGGFTSMDMNMNICAHGRLGLVIVGCTWLD